MTRPAKTILVVDDDRDIAELVRTILTDEGFKVSCIYSYTEVDLHAAVESLDPDCVLLDGGGAEGHGSSWHTALWMAREGMLMRCMASCEDGCGGADPKDDQREKQAQTVELPRQH